MAERVSKARAHSGLSAADLAELVGVSTRCVYYWESGLRLPSLAELCRVAVYCDVTLAFLLFDVDEQREAIAREVA